MFRPFDAKIYDPTNPEYTLVSHYSSEIFKKVSPYILYWKLNKNLTNQARDNIDKLYGESSQKSTFDLPLRVYGHLEISPIIQELSRLGLEQKDEIILVFNIQDINNILGEPPKEGDIVRISYIVPGSEDLNKFYVINRVIPDTATMYNFSFINYLVYAENTALENVPEEVKYSNVLE